MVQGCSSTSSDSAVDRTIQALRRIMHAADVHSSRLNHLFRITGPQITCLDAIVREGPMTQTALGARVSMGLSTINGITDRLEGKGLVARRRDTADRRRVFVSATDAGRDMIAMTPSPLPTQLAHALTNLTTEEQQAIADAFERVMNLMERDTSASRVGPDPTMLPDDS
ncbi:MAG: MarR family winged helix-turn-helix transcriptional regulator [bacterium]